MPMMVGSAHCPAGGCQVEQRQGGMFVPVSEKPGKKKQESGGQGYKNRDADRAIEYNPSGERKSNRHQRRPPDAFVAVGTIRFCQGALADRGTQD